MNSKRITVCTPTFNRAYILHELYESLKKQTFTDFEWLIIDDGSSDYTETLVSEWIREVSLRIRYYREQNGGKHRAVNYGLDLAEGEIFFVVDSDDRLTGDALEKIDGWFRQIADDSDIVGIAANRGFSESKTINAFFSSPFLDKTLLEMDTYTENGRYVLRGERAIAFYTDFHRKYRYPEFEGETFLTEAVVYNRMARDGYKMRFFNDIIWVFSYRDDGLSARGAEIYLKNPRGYGLWFRERAEFQKWTWPKKWRMWYSFYCDLKDRYPISFISECIGASRVNMEICRLGFLLRRLTKRKKV